MNSTKDALREALSAALPGSKPFSDASAEKILEAMEAHFSEPKKPYTLDDAQADILKLLVENAARMVSPPIFVSTPREEGPICREWKKDPDVSELLDAIDAFFLYFIYDPFIISDQANRVRAAYEAVKTKYA